MCADGVASDAVAMDDFIYGEPQAMAAPAGLDTTFGTGGWTTINFGDTDQAEAVLVQPDGKIVVAGTWDGGAGRLRDRSGYNADGTPRHDIQRRRAGQSHLRRWHVRRRRTRVRTGATARRQARRRRRHRRRRRRRRTTSPSPASNPDGTLDTTFSGDGKLVVDFGFDDQAHAVAIQADGKIVVVGQAASDVAVLRLLPDGTLDATFNDVRDADTGERQRPSTGSRSPGPTSHAPWPLHEDGAIVIAGATQGVGTRDFAVVRLLADRRSSIPPSTATAG